MGPGENMDKFTSLRPPGTFAFFMMIGVNGTDLLNDNVATKFWPSYDYQGQGRTKSTKSFKNSKGSLHIQTGRPLTCPALLSL